MHIIPFFGKKTIRIRKNFNRYPELDRDARNASEGQVPIQRAPFLLLIRCSSPSSPLLVPLLTLLFGCFGTERAWRLTWDSSFVMLVPIDPLQHCCSSLRDSDTVQPHYHLLSRLLARRLLFEIEHWALIRSSMVFLEMHHVKNGW
jgi:hypothetical protein